MRPLGGPLGGAMASAAIAARGAAQESTQAASPAAFALISAILTTIVLVTFVGNLFVIVAIKVDKNLQTTANQLVLSLASADLMVACLVMPLGAYNDLGQGWHLGTRVCEFWTSADVLCCTASILNLLAIAIDRYWAVTNADYIYRRTRRRVNLMILCAWTVGAVVSLAPIFGWKDPDFQYRVLVEHKCLVSQDVGYQIFATLSTFYLPLVLLLGLYWRIFQVARKRIHRRPGAMLGMRAPEMGAANDPKRPPLDQASKQVALDKTTRATNSGSLGADLPHGAGKSFRGPARRTSELSMSRMLPPAASGGQEKVDHLNKNNELANLDAAAADADEAFKLRSDTVAIGGVKRSGGGARLNRRQRVRPADDDDDLTLVAVNADLNARPLSFTCPSDKEEAEDEECCCCCRAAATCQVCKQAAGEINRTPADKSPSANQAPDKRLGPDIGHHSSRSQSPTSSNDSSLAYHQRPQISVELDDLDGLNEEDDEELDDEESMSSAFPPPLLVEEARPRQEDFLEASQLQFKLVATLHSADSNRVPGEPELVETSHDEPMERQTKRPRRSLDLRRKFRALGQLVSFVQTSGPPQYASNSSASSSDASSPMSISSSGRRKLQLSMGGGRPLASPGDLSLGLSKPAETGGREQVALAGNCNGERPMANSSTANSTLANLTCAVTCTTAATYRSATGLTSTGKGIGSRETKEFANFKTTSAKAQQEVRREKKAAKTLAIITGVFVCCWLPFFLNAIIMPICGASCTPSDLVLSILLWLGYLNSLLNPIIYTIFSPDFRRAFRRLLCWSSSSLSGKRERRRRPTVTKRN